MEITQKPPLNDGGGLFDAFGVIDSLIVDCNTLPNALFNGQNVRFCSLIVEMVQKLSVLREGVKNDLESREKTIAEQRKAINNLLGEIGKTNEWGADDGQTKNNP